MEEAPRKKVVLYGHVYLSSGLKGNVEMSVEVDDSVIQCTPQGCCIYEDSWVELMRSINHKISSGVTTFSFTGLAVQNKVVARLHRDNEHLLETKH